MTRRVRVPCDSFPADLSDAPRSLMQVPAPSDRTLSTGVRYRQAAVAILPKGLLVGDLWRLRSPESRPSPLARLVQELWLHVRSNTRASLTVCDHESQSSRDHSPCLSAGSS